MLRCPPSRISLTSSDIADFEQRYAARRGKGKTAKVRLSPSPAHSTRLSFVPAEQNIGRIRAASSSSEATIHNEIPTPEKDEKFLAIRETPTESNINKVRADEDEANADLDTLLRQTALSAATPRRRQVDSFYGTEQALEIGFEDAQTTNSMNSRTEGSPHITPKSRHTTSRTPHSRVALGEINSDAYPTDPWARTEPPLLASARARRRQANSQDLNVRREPDEVQEAIIHIHTEEIRSRLDQPFVGAIQVPDIVLPKDDSILSGVSALDPGAPVFLPRTRFGTGSGLSQNTAVTRVDNQAYHADLRVRSSSEQNADINRESRGRQPASNIDNVISTSLSAFQSSARSRRRSNTLDQDVRISPMIPVLDRYPLMRPVSRSHGRLDDSTPHHPNVTYGDALHRTAERQATGPDSGPSTNGLHLQVGPASNASHNARNKPSIRPVSPALSTGSRSTPNLLQYPTTEAHLTARGSSLSWNRDDVHLSSSIRVPSMTSATSGASGGQQMSRQSSREALEAATEFLRMRKSPLDDLTEQFSRMSTSRPRSVGRSWERPPGRPRVSLLTGDPFKPEPVHRALPSTLVTPTEVITGKTEILEVLEDIDAPTEDVVALSLALPPSSPLSSSSAALPSTPSLHFHEPRSPRSPPKHNVMATSPGHAIRRGALHTATRTPKVAVYDDKKPPETQPQTPADIRGSKRRGKTRSDTSGMQPPIYVGQTMMSSPPPIPERHPHRNTYPSTAPAFESSVTAPASPSGETHGPDSNISESSRRSRNQGRFRAQRNNQQVENDMVEGDLQGLESDRRT